MANDKKNANRLVNIDDDPTAELEILALPESRVSDDLEVAASTADFIADEDETVVLNESVATLKNDLLSRSETIDQLQFDLEVLRGKWQGLATELEAREELTKQLDAELAAARQAAADADKKLEERNQTIRGLKSQLEQRESAHHTVSHELASLRQDIADNSSDDNKLNRQMLAMQSGQLASSETEVRKLQARIVAVEDYADQIRYQLRRKNVEFGNVAGQVDSLQLRLETAIQQVAQLQSELDFAKAENDHLTSNLAGLNDAHAEEIRMIRFELGDAQETLTQHERVAEQLASDLVETRSHRTELEKMLSDAEERNLVEISRLKKDNQNLHLEVESMTDKLRTKSEAINCLLAELAKNANAADPVVEIEDAIEEIDTRMSEQIADRTYLDRDRVTRLLIGRIGGQELRFPLFKDRLTMGRTRQNDIQLKSEHISRRHAVVVIEGDVTRVIDWGSKNGVFVNSKRIKEHFLKNGDIVGVGTAEFRYEERPKRDS